MDEESTRQIIGKIDDLKTELVGEYDNNKDRYGKGLLYTAWLAGGTLIITGLSGMVDFSNVDSRDLVLVIGGAAMMIILPAWWWWVDRKKEGV